CSRPLHDALPSYGSTVGQRDLPREFAAKLPTWGTCSTPLVVDDALIVNPGGPEASLVALDCATRRTRWATPGAPAARSVSVLLVHLRPIRRAPANRGLRPRLARRLGPENGPAPLATRADH